jgi:hypothetical protein
VAFWVMTPCSLIGELQHFGVTCYPANLPPTTTKIFGNIGIEGNILNINIKNRV